MSKPTFSVVLFTAAPTAHGAEAGGAFVKLDGREALLRSVELFLNREPVKEIFLVIAADMMEEAKRKYGSHLAFTGVKLVAGGPRLVDQAAAAAEKLSPEPSHVLLHDAARPLVPFSDIDALIAEAPGSPIVALTSPLRTNLAEVDKAGKPTAFRTSDQFVQILSPWSFARDAFVAMTQNKQEPAPAQVSLLKGSPLNIRIGSSADVGLAKATMSLLPKPKVRAPDNPFEEAQW